MEDNGGTVALLIPVIAAIGTFFGAILAITGVTKLIVSVGQRRQKILSRLEHSEEKLNTMHKDLETHISENREDQKIIWEAIHKKADK